jgi:hypothetical protein
MPDRLTTRSRRGWRWAAVAGVIGLGALAAVPAAWALTQTPVYTGVPDQITPAFQGNVSSWARNGPRDTGPYNEYLRIGSGAITQVNGPGTQAFGGGLSGTKLVYQRVYKGQSDLRLYDYMAHTYSTVPTGWNTAVWEWHPTMSAPWVLFGRRNFDIHKDWTLLGNLTTGGVTVLGSEQGSSVLEQPGQVNGNYAVFTQCTSTGCGVYLHDITAGTTTKILNTLGGSYQYSASVTTTGTVYLVHSGAACGSSVKLVKVPLGGTETEIAPMPNGVDVSSTYVDDSSGTPIVYYSRSSCANNETHGDIYKVVNP